MVGLWIGLAVVFFFWCLKRLRQTFGQRHPNRRNFKTMIVLGSGGHTAEMFRFLSTLECHRFRPRCYIIAKTDTGSEAKVHEFEAQLVNHNNINKQNFYIWKIPRSREVGQSYLTSIVTTLFALFASFKIVWRERPDLVLANGPGTCVPILFAAYFFRLIGVKETKLVLAESYACVNHLSMTSRIMYPFVDLFTVQWPQLLSLKPDAKYTGRLALCDSQPSPRNEANDIVARTDNELKNSYVLVTVGSTLFDQLIKTIDDISFVQILKRRGYTGMHIQIGKGAYEPKNIMTVENFEVVVYRYKDSLSQEIKEAGLVIGHAGAGTILDVLEAGKPLVVVPNNSLMQKHQSDIALELYAKGYLFYCECEELVQKLDTFDFTKRLAFPKHETQAFAQFLYELLGVPWDR
jgi:beta-1,4-N-acetylglucosaminyltransferase